MVRHSRSCGDGRRGLALLNVGLPGNLTTDGTMMISLLRAHTLGGDKRPTRERGFGQP